MIIFWILAAGLLVLAMLFVVTPLLSRREPASDVDQDQLNLAVFHQQLEELDADLAAGKLDHDQYLSARRDMERELIHDVRSEDTSAMGAPPRGGRLTALGLAMALPAAAIALYLQLGESEMIPRFEATASGQPRAAPATAPDQMAPLDVLVERLAARMEQTPDDLNGWLMLGRTYFATNQPDKALAALERAYALAPQNPEVILAYAQALATNANGRLAGRPADLIDKALQVEPRSIVGRWLKGVVAFQARDFTGAVQQWEGVLLDVNPQAQEAEELRKLIAEARRRGGMQPSTSTVAATETPATSTPAPTEKAVPSDTAAEDAQVTIQVSLAESLQDKAEPGHTLFVYAKAVSGPPMPLAAKRLRASDLPVTVTLDDSMAMMPAMRLSNFPEITVAARISTSGQVTPQSGDLEGEVGPVKPGQSGPIALIIDQVRP